MNNKPAKPYQWRPIIPKRPRLTSFEKGNGMFDEGAMCKGQRAAQAEMRKMERDKNSLDSVHFKNHRPKSEIISLPSKNGLSVSVLEIRYHKIESDFRFTEQQKLEAFNDWQKALAI